MKKSIKNMFNYIQNSQGTFKIFVKIKNIKVCVVILKILVCKGYIRGFMIKQNILEIFLKYSLSNGVIYKNVIFNPKSSFISYLTLCKLQKNHELMLISTTKGILTKKEAIFYKVGGFVICKMI